MDKESNEKDIDKDNSLKWLEGDEKLLKKIKGIFLKNTPQQIDDLRKAIEAGDAELLERLAHSIKGSAAMIGALLLRDAAYKLELTAMEGDFTKAAVLFDRVDSEYQRVSAKLREIPA